MATQDIAVIITLVIFCCIYLPLSLYQIWRLYSCTYRKIKPIEALSKRQTSLSLICCIAYTIQFIDLSLWSIVYTDWFRNQQNIIFISQFIHLLMQYIFSFFIVLRFWLLYFSVKYETISANHQWKKIINPDYVIEESRRPFHGNPSDYISNQRWFIMNKHKWGNLRYCLKTGGVIAIIFGIIFCVAQILGNQNDDNNTFEIIRMISAMITYGIFLLIWSLMIAIYCRTPSFYDHIYVKKELSHLFHIMVVFFFVYVIFFVIFGFNEEDVYDDSYFAEILILFHCIAICNLCAIHVFTALPIFNLQKFEEKGHQKGIQKEQSMLNVALKKMRWSTVSRENSAKTYNPYDKDFKLEEVLKNEYGFSAFMKHLAHEFSTEVLLSVTEFTMFKKYIYDEVEKTVGFQNRTHALHMVEKATILEEEEQSRYLQESQHLANTEISKTMTAISTDSTTSTRSVRNGGALKRHKSSDIFSDVPYVVLPFDKLPKSVIVYDEESSNQEKAYKLFVKYIQPGAEYEINIAGNLRYSYVQKFGIKEKWMREISRGIDMGELGEIFDKCNDINFSLMRHSFNRFRKGEDWKKVMQAIMSKNSIDAVPQEMPLKK